MTTASNARPRDGRASPLPPDERRRAIIVAARPLIAANGLNVSTREIAEAAGVAEGTLFRVFATKEDVIDAVLADAMDPAEVCAKIAAIPTELPLDARVREVVIVLRDRVREVTGLFVALRLRPKHHPGEDGEKTRRRHDEHNAMMRAAITAVLAPDRDRLRVDPDSASTLLWGLAFLTGHPMMNNALLDDADRATDLLLHGLLASSAQPTDAPTATPTQGPRC